MHSTLFALALVSLVSASSNGNPSLPPIVVVPGPHLVPRRGHADIAIPIGNKRRHHAKIAKLSKKSLSPRAILNGNGAATLYYDIFGGGTCGPINGWSSFAETSGYSMCEPWTNPKTIAQRASNRIVALPSNLMSGNLEKYCGKEVIATWNGKTISGLIAWDGCASCNSNNGLDFSSSIFGELVGTSNCGMGRVQGMTWQLTSNQIWDTNGNPVGGGSNNNDDDGDKEEEKPEPKPEPSSSKSTSSKQEEWTPEPEPEKKPSSTKKEEVKVTPTSTWTPPPPPPPSSSSEWVAPSSSSSSTKKEEPKPTPSPTPTSSSSEKKDDPLPTEKNDENTDNEPSTKGRINLVASPSSSAQATSSTGDRQPLHSASLADAQAAAKAKASESAGSLAAEHVISSSNDGAATATACDDAQGQWRCTGKILQQCIQSADGWSWSDRVSCSVEPINCDTPNPVCPAKASCPVRRHVKLA